MLPVRAYRSQLQSKCCQSSAKPCRRAAALEHELAGGNDFLPDAVARNDRDAIAFAQRSLLEKPARHLLEALVLRPLRVGQHLFDIRSQPRLTPIAARRALGECVSFTRAASSSARAAARSKPGSSRSGRS